MKVALPILLIVSATLGPGPAAGDAELATLEKSVMGRLAQARKDARIPRLTRTGRLDRVASKRARQVADLPFEARMSPAGSIQGLVKEGGIGRYRAVAEHVEVQSGYTDPAAAAIARWKRNKPEWSHVLDPSKTEIGLAVERSKDGMLVLAAVLLSPAEPLPDVASLETEAEAAINRFRERNQLAPLAHSDALAAVARAHSEDMAKRAYFAHETPEGLRPADRVSRGGIGYAAMAENIAENAGVEDPVGVAVEGWIASPPHRENLMNPNYRLTGVGAAVDADGKIYFTQLFLRPPVP